MRIIKEAGSDIIPSVRLYGLRQVKQYRGQVRYRLLLSSEFVGASEYDCLKMTVSQEARHAGKTLSGAYIEMRGLLLRPHMIPPIAISSRILTRKPDRHLYALLVGPSAKLSISLAKDGTVLFALRIGKYRTMQSTMLEQVSRFLEPSSRSRIQTPIPKNRLDEEVR